jgi:outer membrane immunogenic protein
MLCGLGLLKMRHFARVCAVALGSYAGLASPLIAQSFRGPTYNWSGWYLGANAGWGLRNENSFASASYYSTLGINEYDPGIASGSTSKHQGLTAGATLGYQRQFGLFVLGADYDMQYASIADSPKYATASFSRISGRVATFEDYIAGRIDPTASNKTYSASNVDTTDGDNNRWIGIAKLRAGYAVDRVMLFVTGGVAYRFSSETRDTVVTESEGATTTYAGYNTSPVWGYALGGGLEYALSDKITAKFDYTRLNFGAATVVDPFASTAAGKVVTSQMDRHTDLVRATISYRFNFGDVLKN